MKIYTNVFDLARICPRRFWVAPYSDFKIGVKIAEKGAPSAKDFAVKAGLTELTPDEDKVDGFTTYTLKSADTGFVEYTIEVEGVSEKLKLVQITTDSTVFEVGGGGGDVPADVATQSWVNSQISDFVDEDWVESRISDFVEEDALTAYATKDELTAYAETADLTAYAEKTDLTSYVEKTDLTAYYTKSETSSAAELSDAFANVGGGAISAYDVSEKPIQSETLIRQALVDDTCLPQTIVLNRDDSIEVFDVEGTLDLHQNSPSLASLIPNAVKVLVGTKVTNISDRCFLWANYCKDIVFPNSLSGIAAGSPTGEVFSAIPAKRLTIPDSVTTFGNGNIFWNWSQGEVVDFGNTRLTIPTGG